MEIFYDIPQINFSLFSKLKYLMGKLVIVLLFLLGLLFIHRKNNFTNQQTLYYPPPEQISDNNNQSNNYFVGPYTHQPALTLYEGLSRKKINNYFFVIDNTHKVQIALVDIGYAKGVSASFFSGEHTYNIEDQSIKFSLPESFQDSLLINNTIKNSEFFLSSKQTPEGTSVELKLHFVKGDNSIKLSLNYQQPSEGCVTYLRNKVISHKCYGGTAFGDFKIQISNGQKITYQTSLIITDNISSAGLDGFRASGWQWKWVWGMGAGISKGKQLSINFGSIRGIGEDVFQVGNTVIPIKGINYILNQNSTVGDSFKANSIAPQMDIEFKITAKDHRYRDMVVAKVDLFRLEGYWTGYLIDPNTQEKYQLESFPGLVETGDSIF